MISDSVCHSCYLWASQLGATILDFGYCTFKVFVYVLQGLRVHTYIYTDMMLCVIYCKQVGH